MNPVREKQVDVDPPPAEAGRKIDAAKYDAIHRALLTGLIGNVGARAKADTHEYSGGRGKKFHIFPGSSLFKKTPAWVVAAEVTETTRLYARTVAHIKPEWIESVADHLVERSYSEPHYQADSAHVVAYEKVTLFGLTVVPRRRVHYGPIEPKVSRQIFIQQALVEGEYAPEAPWARHNRALLREVDLTEAKLRRRDLLTDAASRLAFFDARVPAGIYNGPLFEKWRRQAEERDRRTLFMRKEDLLVTGVAAPADQFPDAVRIDDVRLPLTYRFDPGAADDGVTANVPLGALNQLPAEPFDWLVPGWLSEKAAALIKTLPKELRVPLVPVPDTVRTILPQVRFGEGELLDALAWHLGRVRDVRIPRSAWRPAELPDRLRMNFRVLDAAGKPVEMGRDLNEIRRKLRVEVRETFASLPDSPWHRDGITRWDFDDLPEQVEVRRPGITLRGYPALVDNNQSVSLRLLDSPSAAAASTRAGLRRLFLLQLGEQARYLARNLPGIDAMSLHYATIGPGDGLKLDILTVVTDRALFDDEPPALIRHRDEFVARAETGWRRLSAAATEVCDVVRPTLASYHGLSKQLSGPFPPLLEPSIRDMRAQLAHLVPKGFVTSTPWPWLKQLPRFLKAAEVRLRKLTNAGATRDQQALDEIRPLWDAYLARRERHQAQGVIDPNLTQFRWMLEELRVSLFAQELKTSVPVSVKRLQAFWADVQKA